MALHTNLPIYKVAYDLLDTVTDLVKNMPRDFKSSIGGKISGQCVADPRSSTSFGGSGKYIVTRFDAAANTVIAESGTGNGAFAVADPRPGLRRERGDDYLTAGHYGVVGLV